MCTVLGIFITDPVILSDNCSFKGILIVTSYPRKYGTESKGIGRSSSSLISVVIDIKQDNMVYFLHKIKDEDAREALCIECNTDFYEP